MQNYHFSILRILFSWIFFWRKRHFLLLNTRLLVKPDFLFVQQQQQQKEQDFLFVRFLTEIIAKIKSLQKCRTKQQQSAISYSSTIGAGAADVYPGAARGRIGKNRSRTRRWKEQPRFERCRAGVEMVGSCCGVPTGVPVPRLTLPPAWLCPGFLSWLGASTEVR